MTDAVHVPGVVELPEDATPLGDLLPIAVRCLIESVEPLRPTKPKKPGARPRDPLKLRKAKARPDRMWILDCETVTAETLAKPLLMPGFDPNISTAAGQALLFGSAHLLTRVTGGRRWTRTHEYLFYPDALPAAIVAKLKRRWRYDTRALGDWREPPDSPDTRSYCIPLSEFLKVLFREAVAKRCLIVGFGLPFDLSRLAFKPPGQARGQFAGGFSSALWQGRDGKEDQRKPRLRIRQITENSTFMAFASYREPGDGKRRHPGTELLDLHQLVYGLTGDSLSLDAACEALGVEDRKTDPRYHGVVSLRYLRYNRQDVLLTTKLAFAALKRFDEHPVSRGHSPRGALSETRVYSPASLGKAYHWAMGVRPRLRVQPNFSKPALAAAMQGFSAARSETWIHKEPVPVAPLDFSSQFPTVAILQKLWALTIARTVEVEESTQAAQALLETVTPEQMFDPAAWPELNQFALVLPQRDLLPTRAMYSSSSQADWKLGLNPYTAQRPQWYALANLVVAKVLTNRTPKIIKAFRLVPHGLMQGLRPTRFAGVVPIDPVEDDFFLKLVEERARVRLGAPPYDGLSELQRDALEYSLKLTVNSSVWGQSFETHEVRLPKKQTIRLWLDQDDIRTVDTCYPQEPGTFFFPPTATLVTAGGQLLLALLQHEVEARGASYVTMDTDSLFATYCEEGGTIEIPGAAGPVHLLDKTELLAIRAKFNRPSPYDPALIPFLLKHEYEDVHRPLYVYSIVPKTYVLFTRKVGDPEGRRDVEVGDIVDHSRSGLGGILPTTTDPDWDVQWWVDILNHRRPSMPDGPLVRRFAIHAWETYNHFKAMNKGKAPEAQMRPFNFYMATQPDSPLGSNDDSPHQHPLVAPLNQNPSAWAALTWYDTGDGEPVQVTTSMAAAMSAGFDPPVCVRSIHDYFDARANYSFPSEFLPPPGGWTFGGMLRRRPVRQESLTLIGREDIAFVELSRAGLVEEHPTELRLTPGWVIPLLPILDDFPDKEYLHKELGVDPSTVHRWITERAVPGDHFRQRLEEICFEHVARHLVILGIEAPKTPANAFERYTALIPKLRIGIAIALEAFTKTGRGQASAVVHEIRISRRTLYNWIDNPDRIPASRTLGDLAYSFPEVIGDIVSSIASGAGMAARKPAHQRRAVAASLSAASPETLQPEPLPESQPLQPALPGIPVASPDHHSRPRWPTAGGGFGLPNTLASPNRAGLARADRPTVRPGGSD